MRPACGTRQGASNEYSRLAQARGNPRPAKNPDEVDGTARLFLRCAATTTTPGDGLLDSLAGTRVRAGTLAAQWEVAAVPQPAIAADFRQPLDVQLHLAAQVTFHRQPANRLAQLLNLSFAQIAHADVRANARLCQQLLAGRTANTVNIGECYLNSFIAWEIHAFNTRHKPVFLLTS